MTQWWVADSYPGISSGGNYGSGGSLPSDGGAIQYRDPLDAKRAAAGQLSQAEYPDGYLGNIIDRRRDKLVSAIQNRLTDQSYQRGVHKGSKISGKDYFWPPEAPLDTEGLDAEATGRRVGNTIRVPRFTQSGNPVEILAHQGKTTGLATPGDMGKKMEEAEASGVNPALNPIVVQDPLKVVHYNKILPKYRTV